MNFSIPFFSEMIRELQNRSQAKIQVDHSGSSGIDPSEKAVTITGTDESVVKAKEMVLFLVANPAHDAMKSLNMVRRFDLSRERRISTPSLLTISAPFSSVLCVIPVDRRQTPRRRQVGFRTSLSQPSIDGPKYATAVQL